MGDELTAHFRGTEARIQALGAKLRVGLTLAIDEGGEVLKEVGQVGFGSLARKKLELTVQFEQAEVHLLEFNQTFEVGQHCLARRW